MNRSTLGLFEKVIRQSIIQFELRVEILNVQISTEEADRGKLKPISRYGFSIRTMSSTWFIRST